MPATFITYQIVSANQVVDVYNKLPEAKDAASHHAKVTRRVAEVRKSTTQVLFTYTPQPTPPPVES